MADILKYLRISFALSLMVAVQAKAQGKQELLDSLITSNNRLGLFNGNVLVIDQGKEVFRKAIGYADASKKVMLTDRYRFHIGSIAKEFNATAIMMLKEQGKLDLSDKVSRFLPGLPKWADSISINNLLQYASGLPDLKWRLLKSDNEAMDSLKKVVNLNFPPGSQYAYNNSNTLLQRKIVEKITGIPFNDFVTRHMLRPLKMNASLVDPSETTPLMAKSYNDDHVQAPLFTPITGWTAVTLDDFYKWSQALERFKLISPASTLAIITPFSARKQAGLGGGTMIDGRLITHTHDGTSINYQALLVSNSTQKRTVILLTNNKQNNLYDINAAIQDILDGKPFRQPKRSVLTALQKLVETGTGTQILEAYRALKKDQAGSYDFSLETTLNNIGYTLMNKKKLEDAIVVFEYNTVLFPSSGNVFDSLGEAYYNKGDKDKALANYKRALALDPALDTAKEKVTELEK